VFTGSYPVDDELDGVGLRLWELAQLFADAGHDVVLVVPRASAFSHPSVRFEVFSEGSWPTLVDASDVVFSGDLPDTRVLLHAHAAGKVIVAETAPPIAHLHLPRVRRGERGALLYRGVLARWRLQLLLADHLVVSSEAGRAAILGALTSMGRLASVHDPREPSLRHFLSVVPVGFTQHAALSAAAARPEGPPVDLVWNGSVSEVCAPDPVLEAMAAANAAGHRLTLRMMYVPDPETLARLEHMIGVLGLVDQVQWPRQAPLHGRRDGFMKSVRAIVITGRQTAETATLHRLRLRDSGLYGLPVVVDHYGATADLVAAYGFGAVADPTDPGGFATALLGAVRDGPVRAGSLNALYRHRDRFELERHIGPLLDVLATGRRAPDIGSVGHRRAVDGLVAGQPEVREAAPALR
jgi:glycosyltransferase involved in cell wall biosynthesis